MDLYTILVFAHIAGTILGVGGATLAEVNIVRALKDGTVDVSERHLMHGTYTTIRVGMAVVFLSGLALVWWHLDQGNNWVITSSKVWVKDVMFAAIVINAILLTKRWIPLWLGSAISFTSWWGATLLGAWRGVPYTFFELLIGYVFITFVMAGVLELVRRYYLRNG